MKTTILQLTSYPLDRPRHGGQIRASQIRDALLASGYSLVTMPIFRSSLYPLSVAPKIDPDNFKVAFPYADIGPLADYVGGQIIATSDIAFSIASDIFDALNPSVFWLEEPWNWPIVRRYLAQKTGPVKTKVVYSSYNYESIAKKRILESLEIERRKEIYHEIEMIEGDLIKSAYCCITVTKEDKDTFIRLGAKQVVLAPNGTSRLNYPRYEGIYPSAIEPSISYGLFVGSAHPPNVQGISEFTRRVVIGLHSDHRVVIAGSVGLVIRANTKEWRIPYMARDRLCLLGEISSFSMNTLIANASCIVLPIEYGGGSNLKTAEALCSNRIVIGTKAAFRGYEGYENLNGVTVVPTINDMIMPFLDALRMAKSIADRSKYTSALFWENTLKDIGTILL